MRQENSCENRELREMKKYVDYITDITCQLLAIDSPTGYTKNAAEFVYVRIS